MATDKDKNKKPHQQLIPFKVGNQLWKLRASAGIDRIWNDPETLYKTFEEYANMVDKNPLMEIAYHQGKKVKIPKMYAMTMAGFCIFCGVNSKYFNHFERDLKEEAIMFESLENPTDKQIETNKLNKDLANIIATIKEIIFTQKFTGAAAGLLNTNLISRELGMLDKREVNHKNDGGAFKGQVTTFMLPSNNREQLNPDKPIEIEPTEE